MSATVEAWKPPATLGNPHASALDDAALVVAEGAALDAGIAALRGLGEDRAERLREVVQAEAVARRQWLAGFESARLAGWLRVLTLTEEAIAGCAAGAKSPVIQIAQLLRERDAYPQSLTPWIKTVSKNRFLPYGSLADRLGR